MMRLLIAKIAKIDRNLMRDIQLFSFALILNVSKISLIKSHFTVPDALVRVFTSTLSTIAFKRNS
jgi:hypothetical protein